MRTWLSSWNRAIQNTNTKFSHGVVSYCHCMERHLSYSVSGPPEQMCGVTLLWYEDLGVQTDK